MKTAVSVDDELIKAADGAARKMGISRSRLFSIALERFLRERRNEEMLQTLNRVYGADSNAEEKAIAISLKSRLRNVAKDAW
jgi:metal-responsive CopG/Arc/MetJ family transcriptional regulator